MTGDLLSSFIKRRLGLAASSQALGLDHLPEALLPLLAATAWFELSGGTIAGLAVAFVVLALALSPVFYWLGVRNRPY
jgi:CDP-2,3-bis-(O-geranylgeranyl)-sn-glycerol synthase